MDKKMDEILKAMNELKEAGGGLFDFQNQEDYLDMAYEADNEEEALKYAKKALKQDKDNVDAEMMIADLTSEGAEELKKKYEKIIVKTEKRLEEDHLFDEDNRGRFWGLIETRPYMRLRYAYMQLLVNQGKMKKAIKECEELLELCENDNLGVRYCLIALYAMFEDEIQVNRLYKKFTEDSALMLLPMVALYYKMDNYRKADSFLKKIRQANQDFDHFFNNLATTEEALEETFSNVFSTGMYSPGSKDEIIVALTDGAFLYDCTTGLLPWIIDKILD